MKKKIIIGMIIYSAIFVVSGSYIVFTIESARSRLDRLITLHQVEILREHYLIQIKRVQSDLLLKSTGYPRNFDTVVSHVMNMGTLIDACFDCHHSGEATARLNDLRRQTEEYKSALSRVLTIRANFKWLRAEELKAFQIGEALTAQVGSMIAMTSARLGERTARALHDISRTKYVFYLLMGFIPILSGVFVLVLIRSLTNPMHVLLESTRQLKSGDLDHRVEGLKDEFGELAVSINEMAGALKEKILLMQQAERDLAKANQDLKLAQEQMVRAETMAAIGTLSSGISHELSTPLSVILNMAQLTKQDVQGNPLLLKDLEVIEYEANQAIKITRSLLGFARSTRSRKETVNLNEVLEDLFKIIEFQPRARHVKLVRRMDPVLPAIHASAGQMRQVFLNIILNAIQAMPDGGTLEVATGSRAEPMAEGVEVVISDTGVGIPEDQIRKIFQPFFTTKEEGTGLGLAITYGIIQEHHGRIGVESRVGEGTTFRIFLPMIDERLVQA